MLTRPPYPASPPFSLSLSLLVLRIVAHPPQPCHRSSLPKMTCPYAHREQDSHQVIAHSSHHTLESPCYDHGGASFIDRVDLNEEKDEALSNHSEPPCQDRGKAFVFSQVEKTREEEHHSNKSLSNHTESPRQDHGEVSFFGQLEETQEEEHHVLKDLTKQRGHSSVSAAASGESQGREERICGADGWSSPGDTSLLAGSLLVPRAAGSKLRRNPSSVRESLLAEAWERKREVMLHEELRDLKDRSKLEKLGRSISYCGKFLPPHCKVGRATSQQRGQHLKHDDDADNSDGNGESNRRWCQTRSLTDDDFEELRGCIDLGFRFDESSTPELCETLPALEVYYAVAQSLHASPTCRAISRDAGSQSPNHGNLTSSTPSWRVSSPGDDPEDVKGRLRHWAQAVACNARLCH